MNRGNLADFGIEWNLQIISSLIFSHAHRKPHPSFILIHLLSSLIACLPCVKKSKPNFDVISHFSKAHKEGITA